MSVVDQRRGRYSSVKGSNYERRKLIDPAIWITFVRTVIILQMPSRSDNMLVMARGLDRAPSWAGTTAGAGVMQLPLIAVGVPSSYERPRLLRDAPMDGSSLSRSARTTADLHVREARSPAGPTSSQSTCGSPGRNDRKPSEPLAQHLHDRLLLNLLIRMEGP